MKTISNLSFSKYDICICVDFLIIIVFVIANTIVLFTFALP